MKNDQAVDSQPEWRMPAEWWPHAATWCSWPRNADTWAANLSAAQDEFVELVRALAAGEPVRVLAGRPDDWDAASRALAGIAGVEVVPIPTNDAWARDYAPTFVLDAEQQRLGAVDWIYNAWGGKYPPFDRDQEVARLVAAELGCHHLPIDLCLEGGAVEIDDHGVLLCTRTCAFDPHRNPQLSPAEIDSRIRRAVGAREILWLTGDALIGDDTNGHIDQLARCAPGDKILYAWTENTDDPQFPGLARNLDDLRAELNRAGLVRELIPLPVPDSVWFRGVQIPACYCNFYLTNRHVIVPQFGVKQDRQAAELIAAVFPDRQLIQLPSVNLTVGLGSFHCLTQQQPAVRSELSR